MRFVSICDDHHSFDIYSAWQHSICLQNILLMIIRAFSTKSLVLSLPDALVIPEGAEHELLTFHGK